MNDKYQKRRDELFLQRKQEHDALEAKYKHKERMLLVLLQFEEALELPLEFQIPAVVKLCHQHRELVVDPQFMAWSVKHNKALQHWIRFKDSLGK